MNLLYVWVLYVVCIVCNENLLYGKRFSLKLKGRVYRTYVRSTMLYGSETWGMREKDVAILMRTERAMIRAMCGVKLKEKRNTKELMNMLGIAETIDMVAKRNSMRWYGHVLRRDEEDVLKKALNFKVDGKRRRGRPRKTWKDQVEAEMKRAGLKRVDALDRVRWRKALKFLCT